MSASVVEICSSFPLYAFPNLPTICCGEMRFLPPYHGRHSFDMYVHLPTVLRLFGLETFPETKDPHESGEDSFLEPTNKSREHPSSLSNSRIISMKNEGRRCCYGTTNVFLISTETFFRYDRT